MKLSKSVPKLSLKLNGVEVYPMIVQAVMKRGLTKHRNIGVGSVDLEDFLSNAVVQVLKAFTQRYRGAASSKPSTYVYQRIQGSFLDLMRHELNYGSRMITSELESHRFTAHPTQTAQSLEDKIDADRERAYLHNGWLTLTATERTVLVRLFVDGHSLAQIGEDMWLSRRNLAVIKESSLQKLRAAFPSNYTR